MGSLFRLLMCPDTRLGVPGRVDACNRAGQPWYRGFDVVASVLNGDLALRRVPTDVADEGRVQIGSSQGHYLHKLIT